MKTATIRMMLDYHIWADHEVWKCVESIGDEQFVQEHTHSTGSVHNQTYHLMETDWSTPLWLQGILPGKDDPAYLKQKNYPDRESLRKAWDQVEHDLNAFVEGLTDEKLAASLIVPMGEDVSFETTWGEMLMSIVNHGTNHRAQILAIINELGGKTVEQGLFFYLMQR